MDDYVNISLDLKKFVDVQVDVRVPKYITLKNCLQVIVESYNLGLDIINPSVRVMQSGQVLLATMNLEMVKNGACLYLEAV